MPADYYRILQISPDAELEVIQAVYRRLARKYHPDASGDAEQMKLLNEAYAILSDPQQRTAYDKKFKRAAAKRPTSTQIVLYQSDLYHQREPWLLTPETYGETEQRGGYFHLAITHPAHTVFKVAPPLVGDCELKVTLALPRANGKQAEAGLVFRYSDEGFYKFALYRDGYYSFSVCHQGKWSRLIERQHSEFCEAENTLLVKAVGRKIKLGVNGELLASLQDDKLGAGRVGLFAATGAEELIAAAKFKDLTISQIHRSRIKD